jgi:hypothetical protein
MKSVTLQFLLHSHLTTESIGIWFFGLKILIVHRVGLKKLSTLTLGFHPTVPNFAQRINISEGTGGRPQEILNIMG